jgi:hypothetical protein
MLFDTFGVAHSTQESSASRNVLPAALRQRSIQRRAPSSTKKGYHPKVMAQGENDENEADAKKVSKKVANLSNPDHYTTVR